MTSSFFISISKLVTNFVNLCDKFRNEYEKTGEIIIFLTHFIGSNMDNLEKLYDLGVSIISTNSYNCSEEASEYVTQINVFDKDYVLEMCNLNNNNDW